MCHKVETYLLNNAMEMNYYYFFRCNNLLLCKERLIIEREVDIRNLNSFLINLPLCLFQKPT